MGGALMELVAKGSQDIFLTGNPSVTYFRSVYKRHTNFSHESVIQSFQGQLDFGKKIECVISRSGDLLSSVVLEIDLPKNIDIVNWMFGEDQSRYIVITKKEKKVKDYAIKNKIFIEKIGFTKGKSLIIKNSFEISNKELININNKWFEEYCS